MKTAVIFFDGACLPVNPGGIATYGFVIKLGDKTISDCGVVCERGGTNNIAEYTALIKALEKAIKEKVESVKIYGDSQLVVYQINGIYSVRSERIIPLYEKAIELLKHFKRWKISWIPREENKEADELSRKAFLDYVEKVNREKAKLIRHYKILRLSETEWKCGNHTVNLSRPSCSCEYFRKINSFPLIKRDNIIVKCKHILLMEELMSCGNSAECFTKEKKTTE